jgi:predicted RND superfamily exporter protein
MTNCCKVVAVMTFLMTLVPVVVFGRFQNEFLRLNIIFSSLLFTFFANEHYIIRLMVREASLLLMNFLFV